MMGINGSGITVGSGSILVMYIGEISGKHSSVVERPQMIRYF